jgi:hypothetical protein
MNEKIETQNSIMKESMVAASHLGGNKKKQPPQVAQAPTIAAPQTTPPAQTPQTGDNGATSNPNQNSAAQQAQQPNTAQTAQTQPKPKRRPKPNGTKPSVAHKNPSNEAPADKSGAANSNTTVAQNIPPKITIQANTPDVGGAISATGPHSDDIHDKLSTEQLLQTTDDNLKSIKRQLTLEEQAQVVQIRNFMAQSRAATTDSDLVRARNLALKAHLLSDELVRHK